jgi:kynurenine formamidase
MVPPAMPSKPTPRLWDISPTIAPDAPIFPGDEPYVLRWTARLGPGCPVNLSSITLSPHVGAHADAPLHYANDAASIDLVDLQTYLGPCRVIHAIGAAPLITIDTCATRRMTCPHACWCAAAPVPTRSGIRPSPPTPLKPWPGWQNGAFG